jgi:hypothetical protein
MEEQLTVKDNLPYFSHDNNARRHPKMKALIAELGYEGYGRFWVLNERIAESSGAFIDISKKVNKLDIAQELGLNGDGLDKFLKFLSDPDINLIEFENRIITIERIRSEYKIYRLKKYMQGIGKNFGIYNANWKGGITPENNLIRNSKKYKRWIRKVFERDNYTCQICKKVGGKLNAHHIKRFSKNQELRFVVTNGITYCEQCHRKWHIEHKKEG